MLRDRGLREDVRGRAVRDDAAGVEQEHPVGVLRRERQVVHRGDEREPGLLAQPVEQLERLLLMPDVERGSRLVEENDLRLLGERARDDDTLLLSAGQRPEAAIGEGQEVEPRERASCCLAIARALLRERPEVWRPAEEHVLRDGHPRRRRRLLRYDGDETRELGARELLDRTPAERDLARERDEPRDRAQERRLPGAVRTDEPEPLPVRDDGSDPVDDGLAAELDGDAAQLDHAAPPRVVRSTSAKNGAPKNAVTTPSGISAGASAVRATTSASTRNPAPTTTDSGISAR